MTTLIKATGEFPESTPSLAVSAGRGNTGNPEIHLSIRDDSGEVSKAAFAWFDRDELLDAITTEESRVRRAVETGEPA